MLVLMSSRRWPLAVAALALLFAGLTSSHAHIHMELNGSGTDTHQLADAAHVHHHHDGSGDHDNLDVDVTTPALAKTFKYDLPVVISPATWALLLPNLLDAHLPAAATTSPRRPPPFSLARPRAPPL